MKELIHKLLRLMEMGRSDTGISQYLAAKIGAERMQAFLDKVGYGNRDISGGLTEFWLGSSIKISAQEQVKLLRELYSGQLPVQKENADVVIKDITLADENGAKLMGKTGSNRQNGKWILGWFVGCVEKAGKRYFFATNIEADDGINGPKARDITKLILKDLKIWE